LEVTDLKTEGAISATDPFDPGYRFQRRLFERAEIAALTPVLSAIPSSAAGKRWAGRELAALLQAPAMQPIVRKLAELLLDMAVLRAVAFRKDADANWFVPAHQDRSIPVPSAALPPGFSNLTRKDGGWQAEAPVELLATMRNCRIFVDRATVDDGPLEVIPGSHRRGRIEQAEIPAAVGQKTWLPLTGEAGDAVILSPLLLHRSRRATEPSGRRVLQLELIPADLAEALRFTA
jgi:ectoine hydroxylase-related dioxygenase (phytanoyl-CoA dioxygenase family)